jgi:predicted ATP-binding protein involved in virulence
MHADTATGESSSSDDVASAPLDTQTVDEMLLQYLDTTRGGEQQQQQVQDNELDKPQSDEVESVEVQDSEVGATSEVTSEDRYVMVHLFSFQSF